ncbi:hypothetical protein E4S40_12610 [Algoriphagus kandeliae]|uniref:DUF975 family protein n=2 Tax=Algoriphagus kandeliae TaxID=2562278 RepID=A0A4Y9QNC5_9BACT|nr:hypothetical protein E4S40_12610 [Algoriphagus kandeliae]
MVNPRKMEQMLHDPVDFSIDRALKRGWEMFKSNPGLFIAFFIIMIAVAAGATYFLEDFASLVTIFVSPALAAGFYLAANRVSREEPLEFRHFFDGFNFWFPVVVVSLVSGILTVFGVIALIIPGIYLGVAYSFSMLFVIFAGTEFWTSMEFSRKLITRIWWRFFAFLILLLVINIVGILCLGVGFLISGPVSYLAVYAAFEDLTGPYLEEEEHKITLPHEPEP